MGSRFSQLMKELRPILAAQLECSHLSSCEFETILRTHARLVLESEKEKQMMEDLVVPPKRLFNVTVIERATIWRTKQFEAEDETEAMALAEADTLWDLWPETDEESEMYVDKVEEVRI